MLTALFLGIALHSPFIPDEANSWAFPVEGRSAGQESPIDLRHLNEEVAGQAGPLRLSADGNDLAYADGRPFRGWMVHLPHGADYEFTKDAWSLDDYRRSARWLAGYGVNLGIIGAIHPSIGQQDPLQVSPIVLEYLHRSVAAAKEAGIYTQLRVAWFHGVTGKALGVEGHEEKDLQCLMFFHPRVQQAWKAWVRQILGSPNPHTGLSLARDPALFSVEIGNEDSLLFWVTDGIQGEARRELERQFGAWAAGRYGSIAKALEAWGGYGDPADQPEAGRLGVMITYRMTRAGRDAASERRARDQLAFLVETSRAWNQEAKRFIQEECGAKHVLVAGSNFVPADRVTMDDALRLLTWQDMDLIQNNHYFTDGGKPRLAGWRADAGGFLGLNSAVRDPLGLPTNKRQVEGKPFLATEILWPRPHPYEVEGPLMVAAYQVLHGIDGLAWAGPRDITWERRDAVYFSFWQEDGSMPMRPFSCAGPATFGQFPAAAAIVRLGLLERGTPVVREVRTRASILAGDEQLTAEEFAYDPTQFAGRAAQDTTARGGVPKEAFLVGPVTVRLGGEADQPKAGLEAFLGQGTVRSNTGQLSADSTRGLFTVDAPAVKAIVGFLAAAGPVRLGDVTLRSDAEHGTVAVVALDGKPIRRSAKVLVQVGARAVPSGWRESPAQWEEGGRNHEGLRIDATGDLPWRVQRCRVKVDLRGTRLRKAQVLDGNGLPVGSVDVRVRGRLASLEVPNDAMYVVMEP